MASIISATKVSISDAVDPPPARRRFSGKGDPFERFEDTHDANMERNLRKKKPLGTSQTGNGMLEVVSWDGAGDDPSRRIPVFCCMFLKVRN